MAEYVSREAVKEAMVEIRDNFGVWSCLIGSALFLGSIWWIWGTQYAALVAGALLMLAGFFSL